MKERKIRHAITFYKKTKRCEKGFITGRYKGNSLKKKRKKKTYTKAIIKTDIK